MQYIMYKTQSSLIMRIYLMHRYFIWCTIYICAWGAGWQY